MKPILSCRRLRERGGWAEDAQNRRCTIPIGPRNTVSNLAYAAVAVWVVVSQVVAERLVMAAALLLLAVGSALYHATKQVWANNLDWAGMGACMGVLDVVALFPGAPGLTLGAFSISMAASVMIAQHMHFDRVMGGMFLVALIPAYLRGDTTLATVSLLLFALAMLAWQADKRRWKVVGLWGHAIWHVLTAAALGLLFAALV